MNMQNLFYEELRKKRKEIDELKLDEAQRLKWQEALVRTRGHIETLSRISRKCGPLELESALREIPKESVASCLIPVFLMVVDGENPKKVEEACLIQYYANGFCGYEGLIFLMYMQGILSIRKREHPIVLGAYLKAMLPEDAASAYEVWQRAQDKEEKKKEWLDPEKLEKFCQGEFKWDKGDPNYELMKLTDTVLMQAEGEDVARWLWDVEDADLIVSLLPMNGETKKHVFQHFSKRQAETLFEDIEELEQGGEIRKDYTVECVRRILDQFFILLDIGEFNILNAKYDEWRGIYEHITL